MDFSYQPHLSLGFTFRDKLYLLRKLYFKVVFGKNPQRGQSEVVLSSLIPPPSCSLASYVSLNKCVITLGLQPIPHLQKCLVSVYFWASAHFIFSWFKNIFMSSSCNTPFHDWYSSHWMLYVYILLVWKMFYSFLVFSFSHKLWIWAVWNPWLQNS